MKLVTERQTYSTYMKILALNAKRLTYKIAMTYVYRKEE